MSRPSNPQPFAPTGAEVQYEAPHGLLKLRGGHDQPGTSAYPELDQKGVSLFFPLATSAIYLQGPEQKICLGDVDPRH
jgi:hypothetical protein